MTKVAKSSNRGSKPGERRGGRQKGVPNKATAELKDLARQYTCEALEALVKILRESESDQAKVSAAREVLDRGYGKATTVIGGDASAPLTVTTRIELVGVKPDDNSAN